MRVLSFIEDPLVVRRILDHLGLWDAQMHSLPSPIEPIVAWGDLLTWVAQDPYPFNQAAANDKDPA
jgi:hypothetical protein